ncbi:MAG: hypothetical protein FWC87_07620 [Acidimicrobiaceae bacterium]|nr:hypothetical protein [Acidimicrobiaceae bacterium]
MDAGNESENQAGTGDETEALTAEGGETGWGAPAGSTEDPGPVRRRSVVRSSGTSRWERSGWSQDPGDWGTAGSDGDATEPGSDLSPPAGGRRGSHWRRTSAAPPIAGAALGGELAADGEDPTIGQPDHPDPEPIDAEGAPTSAGGVYGGDATYAPVDDYEETGLDGLAGPVGTPEAWGANSFEVGTVYQRRGYGGSGPPPTSPLQPPQFPSDPYYAPVPPRRHGGALAAAALGALVLVGGGVAALVTLGGHNSPAATSNPPTSLANNSATTTPATLPPTTPSTTTPPTTNPAAPGTTIFATPTTTLPSTTLPRGPATLGLSSWTAQELHLILQIKGDLTNLNRDMDAQPDFSLLSVDATNLQQDLQSALSGPVTNDPTVAQEWTQLTRDMSTSNNDLNRAIQARDPNLAQDLAAPVTITDSDYNTLSHTLNEHVRHADFGPGKSKGKNG